MKFKPDKKYISIGITAFIVAVCIILFVFAVFNYPVFAKGFSDLIRVLSPAINGLLIAYLLNPVVTFFETKAIPRFLSVLKIKEPSGVRYKRLKRYISIGFSVILTISFISLFISIMIPQLVSSVASIVKQLPQYAKNVNEYLIKLFDDNPRVIEFINQYYEKIQDITNDVMSEAPVYINRVWTTISQGVMMSLSFIWNLLLGFILSVYLLSLKEKFLAQFRKIIIAIFERQKANSILDEIRLIDGIFKDYIVSSIVDSLIIGFLCFILCMIIGIPYAILISFIVGITNIIPFFGPFIGAVPSAIIIFMMDPMKALYFAVMILFLQQFDGNVLKPKLFGDSTGLPAFWVVVSIIVGGGFFGVMGMYLGTPVFAVIYNSLKRLIAKKLNEKGLPSETSKYVRSGELPFEIPKEEKTEDGMLAASIIEMLKDTISFDEGKNDDKTDD